MRILFFQWNAFMQREIEEQFVAKNIDYGTYYYVFKDWEHDDKFMQQFEDFLRNNTDADKNFDAVFSVNFAPLISKVCNNLGIKYISWIYDCPLHIKDVSSLALSCNDVYFFDRTQVEKYSNMFSNVQNCGRFHHLPLAVKPNPIEVSDDGYNCDVSLLGKLYKSEFNYLCGPLDEYHRGYLEGIVQTQMQLPGGYLLGDLINESLMSELNGFYKKAGIRSTGKEITVSPQELEFTLATEVTGRHRFMALALLQSRVKTALYSGDKDPRLDKVIHRGYVDYYKQMPEAFARSKVNLNISLCAIPTGIPLRVLDILGTGSFLVSNMQSELLEYFIDGESIVIYENIQDLIEKVCFYVEHDNARMKIEKNGHEIVKKAFSYSDRVDVLLEL